VSLTVQAPQAVAFASVATSWRKARSYASLSLSFDSVTLSVDKWMQLLSHIQASVNSKPLALLFHRCSLNDAVVRHIAALFADLPTLHLSKCFNVSGLTVLRGASQSMRALSLSDTSGTLRAGSWTARPLDG
jgi:hypothetical protein